MSDQARLWSRRLRGGFNMGEHAIARELAEYAAPQSNLCFPKIDTLGQDLEASRSHIKRILNRLETWRVIWRVEHFEEERNGRQTSHRFQLNLERHFPDPPAEGRSTRDKNPHPKHGKRGAEKPGPRPYDKRDLIALAGAEQGKRLLKAIHQFFRNDQTLVQGIKEAFLEKNPSSSRTTIPRLWVAVESETAERRFIERLPELAAALRKESPLSFEIELLQLFYAHRNNRAGDPKPV